MTNAEPPNSEPITSPAYANGLRTRQEVMGASFVAQALTRTSGSESEQLQHFITEHVWDAVWNRPGLEHRDRSLLNLGILTALRAHDELRGHVRGALNNGLTRAEITESIIHTSGYCGAPAALAAMRVVQEEFDKL
jgi:4-carboxymuconolactone decarboxylase